MRDTNLVNALREHAYLVEALTGDSGWRHMLPQVDGSDFPTQWMPSALECSIIDAQAKEIDALRNELCLKCGNYTQAHVGACDGCRWRR